MVAVRKFTSLLRETEIDRYRGRGARSNGVRWSASANECRADSVTKRKKQETRADNRAGNFAGDRLDKIAIRRVQESDYAS